ncbi:MAG: nuclease [Candidatus Atribacteria bacterium]|nr:nuclease [Candidatus Atribacteria bacterium]
MNKIFIIITLITLLTLPTIAQTYEVSRVIDSDTIELSNGEQVRYIGIDTPEFHNGIPDPYAQEAYEANRKLVEGKEIYLEFDAQERDKYGRILAYVYVDGIFVNAWLIENGYAQIMTIPPNITHQELFLPLQTKAREGNRGLWGFEGNANIESGDIIYPYVGKRNSMKFHHYYYNLVNDMKEKNKVFFKTREEAIEAGYVPCKRCKL